jgi:hypothetical protein
MYSIAVSQFGADALDIEWSGTTAFANRRQHSSSCRTAASCCGGGSHQRDTRGTCCGRCKPAGLLAPTTGCRDESCTTTHGRSTCFGGASELDKQNPGYSGQCQAMFLFEQDVSFVFLGIVLLISMVSFLVLALRSDFDLGKKPISVLEIGRRWKTKYD